MRLWGEKETLKAKYSTAHAIDTGDATWMLRADGKVAHGTGLVRGLKNVIAISRGEGFTAVLLTDGTVQVIGDTAEIEAAVQPPDGTAGIVAISAGRHFILALRRDGTAVVWGSNAPAETQSIPSSAEQLIGIAAGGRHCLALRRDGSVIAWGANDWQQCEVPDLSSVEAIAAGDDHNLALQADGQVIAWGRNDAGQTEVPTWEGPAVQIAAGRSHSLALLQSKKRVVAWGSNTHGETTISPKTSPAVAISAGDSRSAVLRSSSPLPVWTSATLGSGVVGTAYKSKLSAKGRGLSYWAYGLPQGLRMNRVSGAITGTPQEPGYFTVRVRVRNSGGEVTRLLPLVIAAGTNAPSGITLDTDSVNEGAAAGTLVGRLSASDNDPQDTFQFEIVPGENAAPFTISAGNELRTTAPLDFESTATLPVQLRVTDSYGLSFEQTLTVQVLNQLLDSDGDGLSDDQEQIHGSSDTDRDSDDDGVDDLVEVDSLTSPTDPASFPTRVVVWGAGTGGLPANIPPNLGKVKQILALDSSNGALRGDGSVVTWGAPQRLSLPTFFLSR